MTGIIPGLLMGAYASSKAAAVKSRDLQRNSLPRETATAGLRFCMDVSTHRDSATPIILASGGWNRGPKLPSS